MSCCSFTGVSSQGTQRTRCDPEVQSLRREVDCLTQWLSTAREESSAMQVECEVYKREAGALAQELQDAYLECGCQEVELQQATTEIAEYRVAVGELEDMIMGMLSEKAACRVGE